MPGFGGTQRLPKAVGKSKAMKMILTGDLISAKEALNCHLLSDVYSTREELLEEAFKLAEKIAS
jgi:enoyl-CoA hydratase/carnithine racemase